MLTVARISTNTRAMPKKRKPGPRTKSGRLSRAYKSPELRDKGTPENQNKRAYVINGADPQLAASASGILLANKMIGQDQHVACMRYAHAHALVFGKDPEAHAASAFMPSWPHADQEHAERDPGQRGRHQDQEHHRRPISCCLYLLARW
jgi:hypothetical protein